MSKKISYIKYSGHLFCASFQEKTLLKELKIKNFAIVIVYLKYDHQL